MSIATLKETEDVNKQWLNAVINLNGCYIIGEQSFGVIRLLSGKETWFSNYNIPLSPRVGSEFVSDK